MKFCFKILIICLVLFTFLCNSKGFANNDSLAVFNEEYKNVLHNDNNFLDVLFYKHFNNTKLINLGTYGSTYYFPITYFTDNQDNVFAPKQLKNKILSLSNFKPFTNLTWINAGRREQILSIHHIQRFGKIASLNFDYKRVSSPGIYINQEANQNVFNGEFKFNTLNNLYEVKVSSIIDRINNQENGGLNKIEHFEKDTFDRRSLFAVNNENSYYTLKRTNFNLSQRLNIVQFNNDSLSKSSIFIGLENEYNTQRRSYFDYDLNSPIYSSTFLDSTSNLWVDSTFNKYFRNNFNFGFKSNNVMLVSFFDYYQFSNFQYVGLDSNFSSSYVGLNASYFKKKSELTANIKFGLNGYNKGDFITNFSYNYTPSENLSFQFLTSYNLIEPDLYFKDFTSNHFVWKNDSIEKEQTIFINAQIHLQKYKLKLFSNVKLMDNFIYYDSLAFVKQHHFATNNISLGIEKDYSLYKFHFKTAFIYQLTSDEYLKPLPNYIGRQVAYYENKLFKRALKVRVGANLSYTSSFYAYDFMPSISAFYVQGNQQIGNYPFVDFFISTHLKRAQIFFKWEHVNAGMSGYSYLQTPTTPAHDRSFKFGVSWNMFD